jgi:hypothetical protein
MIASNFRGHFDKWIDPSERNRAANASGPLLHLISCKRKKASQLSLLGRKSGDGGPIIAFSIFIFETRTLTDTCPGGSGLPDPAMATAHQPPVTKTTHDT